MVYETDRLNTIALVLESLIEDAQSVLAVIKQKHRPDNDLLGTLAVNAEVTARLVNQLRCPL